MNKKLLFIKFCFPISTWSISLLPSHPAKYPSTTSIFTGKYKEHLERYLLARVSSKNSSILSLGIKKLKLINSANEMGWFALIPFRRVRISVWLLCLFATSTACAEQLQEIGLWVEILHKLRAPTLVRSLLYISTFVYLLHILKNHPLSTCSRKVKSAVHSLGKLGLSWAPFHPGTCCTRGLPYKNTTQM